MLPVPGWGSLCCCCCWNRQQGLNLSLSLSEDDDDLIITETTPPYHWQVPSEWSFWAFSAGLRAGSMINGRCAPVMFPPPPTTTDACHNYVTCVIMIWKFLWRNVITMEFHRVPDTIDRHLVHPIDSERRTRLMGDGYQDTCTELVGPSPAHNIKGRKCHENIVDGWWLCVTTVQPLSKYSGSW